MRVRRPAAPLRCPLPSEEGPEFQQFPGMVKPAQVTPARCYRKQQHSAAPARAHEMGQWFKAMVAGYAARTSPVWGFTCTSTQKF